MRKVTGQDVIAAGMDAAGGGEALAKAAHLREITGAGGMDAQVRRWAADGTPQFGEVLLAVLDYLGAVNWSALLPPDSRDAIEAELRATKRRQAHLQRLLEDWAA